MAAVDVLVAHAEALRAEQEGDAVRRRRQRLEQTARRAKVGRPKSRGVIAVALGSSRPPAPRPAWPPRAWQPARRWRRWPIAMASSRLGASASRGATSHRSEAHHLDRARRRTDVAGVAGADEDEARSGRGSHGGWVKSRLSAVFGAASPCSFSKSVPFQAVVAPCRKRFTPCSTSPSRRHAAPGPSSTAPRSTWIC